MFWGLIMEPQRRYTQEVQKSFHISMAALDASTSSDEPAQVMCTYDGRNYLLCTLTKPTLLQCNLDLNFEVGSEVSFATNGKSHVHLTGYIHEDDFPEDGDEEEEEDDEAFVIQQPQQQPLETKKNKKRSQPATENGKPAKKPRTIQDLVVGSSIDEESSDEDDSDFLVEALESSDVLDEEDDEDDAGEEEDQQEGEEEDDEDSSLSEDEPEEEVVVEAPKKAKASKKEKKLNGVETKQAKNEKNKENQTSQKKKVITGGVIIEDLKEGTGQPAKNGRFVGVYYEGRLKSNSKVFDSALKGKPFEFKLGDGEVIKSWDVGVAGMKVGGKRRITCPPNMAYGTRGSPPQIPPNSTLIFEVELKKVR